MRLQPPGRPLRLPVWELDWEAGEPGLEPYPERVRLARSQKCEWVERQPEREKVPGVGRRVLSGRLARSEASGGAHDGFRE